MSQLTKKAIRESFLRLLDRMAFDKITVKDIVEDCGVNRNTFYYHYQDIYALLQEIMDEETEKVIGSTDDYDTWQEGILHAISFALENRRALYHLYNSINRQRIERYLHDVTGKIMLTFVRKQVKDLEVDEQDIVLIASFYECALVGMCLQWLDGGMKSEIEYVVHRLGVLMEGNIRVMLERV